MKEKKGISTKETVINESQEGELYLIGNHLFEARRKRKLTQKEVARKLSISSATVSNNENGTKLTIPALNAYSQLYEVPVEFFFKGDEHITEPLRQQIDERELMGRIIKIIHPWYLKGSYKPLIYLSVDEREIERWKVFAEGEQDITDNTIKTVPFIQYQRIAAELGLSMYHLLFDK